MNIRLRKTAIFFGAGLVLTAAGACRRDTKPTPDVLAQDSTLNLAVMAANQDSASDTVAFAAPRKMSTSTAPAPATKPATAPVRVVVTKSEPKTVSSLSNRPGRRTSARKRLQRTSASARHVRLASNAYPRATRQIAHRTVYARSVPNRPIASSATSTEPAETTTAVVESVPAAVALPRNRMTVPAGSSLALASNREICSNTSKIGQQFDTRLTKDVMGSDGVLIPEGTIVTGQITSIGNGDPGIGVRLASLTFGGRTYPIGSQVTYTEVDRVKTSSRNSGAKIVAGAGLGALLGRMMGGDIKSTVIGAVGGAAAGGVLANAGSASYAHCVPNGGQIVARLTEPLRLASAN